MNYRRLGIVIGIAVWLPVSVFLAHLIPDTPWPVAVIVGPMFSGGAALFLGFAFEMARGLWNWLREKPETTTLRCNHVGAAGLRCVDRFEHRGEHSTDSIDRKENPVMSLERWHRLYDRGIDPDTHKCEDYARDNGVGFIPHYRCPDCREAEKELAE